MRLQAGVDAVNQPGFGVGRVIRHEDIARGEIDVTHAARKQLVPFSGQLAQHTDTPPKDTLPQIHGRRLL
ncbi:hypothetical protein, partial [Pseudomonas aeruginosa]